MPKKDKELYSTPFSFCFVEIVRDVHPPFVNSLFSLSVFLFPISSYSSSAATIQLVCLAIHSSSVNSPFVRSEFVTLAHKPCKPVKKKLFLVLLICGIFFSCDDVPCSCTLYVYVCVADSLSVPEFGWTSQVLAFRGLIDPSSSLSPILFNPSLQSSISLQHVNYSLHYSPCRWFFVSYPF